jgi:hypothetical protein
MQSIVFSQICQAFVLDVATKQKTFNAQRPTLNVQFTSDVIPNRARDLPIEAAITQVNQRDQRAFVRSLTSVRDEKKQRKISQKNSARDSENFLFAISTPRC